MDLLVIGHVTCDEIGGATRLGGAASYAALAAACLGYETALVTAAPPDHPLLQPLQDDPRVTLHCVASQVMTTFALDYAGAQRRLRLRRRARPLVAADVPVEWRRAPVAYIGPVAGECDGDLVRGLQAGFVGAGLQGWLRRTGPDGAVEPIPFTDVTELHLPEPLDVAVLSVDDHPRAETLSSVLGRRGATVALTRGALGAALLTASTAIAVPAAPAHEVEPTGAGDVFGVVLTLELARGAALARAGEIAAAAAARVVEGPGLGTLAASGADEPQSQSRAATRTNPSRLPHQ